MPDHERPDREVAFPGDHERPEPEVAFPGDNERPEPEVAFPGGHERLDPEIGAHYAGGSERERLGPWNLERVRTWELLGRHLPVPPAVVLDVGGAAGVYARPWRPGATGSTWSTRWPCTSTRRWPPPAGSRPLRWPARRSGTRGG